MADRENQNGDTGSSIGRWMAIASWLILLAFGTVFAQRALDAREAALRPVVGGDALAGYSLELRADRRGHYFVTALVNGLPVEFIVDTGASGIAIPGQVAERLGLERGRPFPVQTAAGRSTAWSTRLDSLTVGPFRRDDVPASISPAMDGRTGLLGMTFLSSLELVQRDGRLTLRGPVTLR